MLTTGDQSSAALITPADAIDARSGQEATDNRSVLAALIAGYARTNPPATIAVIGNAPMPVDSVRAKAIDAADLVVRMTSFDLDEPTDPPCLGRRTDVVAVHRGVIASPYTFADHTSRLYLLVEPGRLHGEPEELPHWWPVDLGHVPVSNREFTLPLLGLLGLDPASAQWPTTGTLLAYVMSELFPAASLLMTGISLIDQPDQVVFAHSWGEPVDVTPEHRLHAEAALLRGWADEGRIELLS